MLSKIITIILFVAVLISVVFFARGYRINIQDAKISSQGLVAVTSSPKGASIYVNGTFTDVTDTSLYLDPGNYVIKVQKEGYAPWTKTVQIQGEIVQSLDATLYPLNASLSPLTNIGIAKAIPFGIDAKKILLFTAPTNPSETPPNPTGTDTPSTQTAEPTAGAPKDGIFVFDTRTQAISLFPTLNQIVAYENFTAAIDPQSSLVYFSPDFEQIALLIGIEPETLQKLEHRDTGRFGNQYVLPDVFESAYLLNVNDTNISPLDITASVENLLSVWGTQKAQSITALLSGYDKKIHQVLSAHTTIIDMSLDKTKIIYEATASALFETVRKSPLLGSNQTPEMRSLEPNNIYIYDIKEDKNYKLFDTTTSPHDFLYPFFHPNSKNIVYSAEGSIHIMDYDGLNKQKIYAGPYEKEFITMAPDSRILILTNFNPAQETSYDLYALGTR